MARNLRRLSQARDAFHPAPGKQSSQLAVSAISRGTSTRRGDGRFSLSWRDNPELNDTRTYTGCRLSRPLCFLRYFEAWVLSTEGKKKYSKYIVCRRAMSRSAIIIGLFTRKLAGHSAESTMRAIPMPEASGLVGRNRLSNTHVRDIRFFIRSIVIAHVLQKKLIYHAHFFNTYFFYFYVCVSEKLSMTCYFCWGKEKKYFLEAPINIVWQCYLWYSSFYPAARTTLLRASPYNIFYPTCVYVGNVFLTSWFCISGL